MNRHFLATFRMKKEEWQRSQCALGHESEVALPNLTLSLQMFRVVMDSLMMTSVETLLAISMQNRATSNAVWLADLSVMLIIACWVSVDWAVFDSVTFLSTRLASVQPK